MTFSLSQNHSLSSDFNQSVLVAQTYWIQDTDHDLSTNTHHNLLLTAQ